MTTLVGATRTPLRARLRLFGSRLVAEPGHLIGAALAIALAYLVLAPMLAVLGSSTQLTRMDAARLGGRHGDLTLAYFERVFTSAMSDHIFWTPLANTLSVAAMATALAVVFGVVLAALVTSTNIWGRKALGFLLIIPYMLPSQAIATAWITVFKNRRTAGPAGVLEALGFSPPDWLAYGQFPIVICLALSYFPFAFLFVFQRTQQDRYPVGGGGRHVGGRAREPSGCASLLPLLIPTTMSVLLLTVARTLGTFAAPYVLGTPVRLYALVDLALFPLAFRGARRRRRAGHCARRLWHRHAGGRCLDGCATGSASSPSEARATSASRRNSGPWPASRRPPSPGPCS